MVSPRTWCNISGDAGDHYRQHSDSLLRLWNALHNPGGVDCNLHPVPLPRLGMPSNHPWSRLLARLGWSHRVPSRSLMDASPEERREPETCRSDIVFRRSNSSNPCRSIHVLLVLLWRKFSARHSFHCFRVLAYWGRLDPVPRIAIDNSSPDSEGPREPSLVNYPCSFKKISILFLGTPGGWSSFASPALRGIASSGRAVA